MRGSLQAIINFADGVRGGNIAPIVGNVLQGKSLSLCDIGAAGGVEPRWRPIARHLSVIAFEPDERSSRMLEDTLAICRTAKVERAALWDKEGPLSFHLCREPKVSSHFEPNIEILGRFPNVERVDVIDRVTIEARPLDSFDVRPDFIKLDIQGGELAVLQGASSTLADVMGVECEVEFVPIYKGQPLFGDIAKYLASHGLEFNDFVALSRESRETGQLNYGLCTFGDALFLRTPEQMAANFSEEKLRRYVAVLVLYNRIDLVKRLGEILDDPGMKAELLTLAQKFRSGWKFSRLVYGVLNFLTALTGRETRAYVTY